MLNHFHLIYHAALVMSSFLRLFSYPPKNKADSLNVVIRKP